ncbi:PiggyBac transposable element-derived protein 4 [Chionoecetes opilio]|uniref:PiggyBac transposable element-derived protein 4 n=1 Tax=Chionoecetes opilio TaxID=41210 RepID=A0A8J4Y6U3_CHIOP|nr:PiggyBac transposable element-derived protein 4 [Chionoecetes opilio]
MASSSSLIDEQIMERMFESDEDASDAEAVENDAVETDDCFEDEEEVVSACQEASPQVASPPLGPDAANSSPPPAERGSQSSDSMQQGCKRQLSRASTSFKKRGERSISYEEDDEEEVDEPMMMSPSTTVLTTRDSLQDAPGTSRTPSRPRRLRNSKDTDPISNEDIERLSSNEVKSRKQNTGVLRPSVGEPIKKISQPSMKAKDGTRWRRDPNASLPRIVPSRIVKGSATAECDGASTAGDYLSMFIDDTMLEKICVHTNAKIDKLAGSYKQHEQYTVRHVELIEMKAFIGLLIIAGVRKDNHLPVASMWSRIVGASIYRATMTERRFSFLLRAIRFDDRMTRPQRLQGDRLAPIRVLWDAFVEHCIANYSPGAHLTVDEQLVAFRGNCAFRMYIANKHANHLLKHQRPQQSGFTPGKSTTNCILALRVLVECRLIFESMEVLVMALEALHEEAKPLGLEVSWLKTKVQVFGGFLDETVQSVHACGEDIEILYGLKIVMVCDAESHYMLNAIPYLGKGTIQLKKNESLGKHLVLKLTSNCGWSGRTVTADNWFSSLPLALELKKAGMEYVGTIRSKPYIPTELIHMKIEIGESVAVFNHEHNVTLQCTRANKTKRVHILSTMHHIPTVVEKKRTNIQVFYNATKGGVDTFDQVCGASSCSRKTRRWPLCMFFGIINIALNNSFIISCSKTTRQVQRRDFNIDAAYSMCRPWAVYRLAMFPFLSRALKVTIQHTFELSDDHSTPLTRQTKTETRKKCYICPTGTNIKTRIVCASCQRSVCTHHGVVVCHYCN